jgi:hypothetical protein
MSLYLIDPVDSRENLADAARQLAVFNDCARARARYLEG